MRFLLMNGPPRSGKRELAKRVVAAFQRLHGQESAAMLHLATPLKEAAHAMMMGYRAHADYFEARKFEPCAELDGLIPRKLYIALAEKVIRPMLGQDYYAKLLVRRVQANDAKIGRKLIVVEDVGFNVECTAIAAAFPQCRVVRMHRLACNFLDDSRSYVEVPLPTQDVQNDGPLEALDKVAEELARA